MLGTTSGNAEAISVISTDLDEVKVNVDTSASDIVTNSEDISMLQKTTGDILQNVDSIEQCVENLYVDYLSECVPKADYLCQNDNMTYANWKLPSNDAGEPAILPNHYNVNLTFTGLKEEDKGPDKNVF